MSMLFLTSGIGQQFTFPSFLPGSVREVTLIRIHVARIVEMDELLQALDVAVVKELLLEVRYRLPSVRPASVVGHCGGVMATLRAVRHLHLAVDRRRKLYPIRVRIGGGSEAASEESSQSQISVAEAVGIGGEPEGIRRVLIIESIPGIQRQAFIGRAEAGEQRPSRWPSLPVSVWPGVRSGGSSVEMA